MRYTFLILAWLLTIPVSARQPNIVMILADDLGYGDVGCYNPESKVPTPHLDQLAKDGIRFTDAHSPSTVCTPSRYSLLTGRMCFRTGLRGVFTGVDGPLIEQNRLTIAELLRRRGYATACVGKWHVGMTFLQKNGKPVTPARGGGIRKVRTVDFSKAIADGPTAVGFDYFFGTACCPTTDFLYAFIENDRVTKVPTEMIKPQTKHWLEYEHFRDGLISSDFKHRNVDLTFLKKSQAFLSKHAREHPNKPFFLYHATQSAHLPAMPAKQFVGKTKAGPLGDFIFELDYVVGELVQTLKKLKMDDNTLIIFSSDNGPEIVIRHMRKEYHHDSARPWRGMKRDNWEGGHRVPFIARWPGKIKPGSVSKEPISLTDIMATCAAITGATIPKDAAEDSFDILPALLGKNSNKPLHPYLMHQTISNAIGIRDGTWKLLDHPGSGGNNYNSPYLKDLLIPNTAPKAPGQLYNLKTDPGEKTNLYLKQSGKAKELKAKLEQLKKAGRSTPR